MRLARALKNSKQRKARRKLTLTQNQMMHSHHKNSGNTLPLHFPKTEHKFLTLHPKNPATLKQKFMETYGGNFSYGSLNNSNSQV